MLLAVFLIPLIPATLGFGYELIKIVIFLSLTIISSLIYLYGSSYQYHKSINGRSMNCDLRWTKIKKAGLIFLIILSLASVFGIHPLESLVGKHPYYQGLVIYWFLFLFSLMVSEIGVSKKKLVQVLSSAALIVAIVSIIQFIMLNLLKIEIPNYAGRVISTFGQPNLYGGFLLLLLPFIFELKKQKLLVATVVSLGILASLSKAAIILLLGLGLVWLFGKFKRKGALIFITSVFLLNALVFSLENSTGLIWEEVLRPLIGQGTEGDVIEKRIYIIPVMLDIYYKSPVLGFGVDSINNLYSDHFADFKPELRNYPPLYFNLMNLTIDRSHNYFLDLLIFSGVVGLLAYFYLLSLLFKSSRSLFLKVFLILYLIWIQFQVQSIAHLMLFWLVVGAIDNKDNFTDNKS